MSDEALERLVRVETKLDALIEQIKPVHNDHEMRLRILESFRWKLLGGCAVLAFFSGGLGAALLQAIAR